MDKEKRKLFNSFGFKIFLIMILTIVSASAVTYGFFVTEKKQTGHSSLESSCFNVAFTDQNSINLTNAYSMEDAKGQTLDPYTFTITNTCDIEAAYSVLINTKTGSFSATHINYSLNKEVANTLGAQTENTKNVPTGYDKSYIVKKGTLKKGQSATYDVRLWINAETTYEAVQGKSWEGEVRVVSTVAELEPKVVNIGDVVIPVQDPQEGVPNFALPATTDETANGLFSLEDDYGTSYYYRGTAPNNYIKFGKDASGQDMWWRIIRFNGDGSIRMQYDGSGASGSNTYTRSFALTNQLWNSASDDAKYVGWMFGGTDGSASTSREEAQRNEISLPIKIAVDDWYKANIVDTGYNDYVQDAIFCNDRSTPGKSATGWTDDTGLGYGSNTTAYGAYARSGVQTVKANNVRPQFTCPQENDKFTVNVENGGNGGLTYPVGLITADEIVAAGSGALGTSNSSYYLNKNSWYWSLSPFGLDNAYAFVFGVNPDGDLNIGGLYHSSGAVAPVINLGAEYLNQLRGTGTASDPFRIG